MIKFLIITTIVLAVIALVEILVLTFIIRQSRETEDELNMLSRANEIKAKQLYKIEKLVNNTAYGNYQSLLEIRNKIKKELIEGCVKND